MDKDRLQASRDAITRMGGPNKAAITLFGDVRKQNRISNWKTRGVPGRFCAVVSQLSGIPINRLCPPPEEMQGADKPINEKH
jgi:hypothetical protein